MLSTKALLVIVSISQWGARKKDKKASQSVETQFSAGKQAGSYNKKLLPGARELEKVSSLAGSIRQYFYDNTLPWLSDGTRILASKNYIDFARGFQAKQAEFSQAVEDLLAVYPALKADAAKTLGNLYEPLDYPDESKIRAAFQCEVSYLPMPQVGDFRVEVSEAEKTKFISKMRDVEAEAVAHCFKQLEGVIRKAVERLSSPDAKFKDSLIDNISELCTVLPKLNVTENVELEAARREVEALVSKISPETCREDATERQSVAQRLKEIQEKMGAYMGQPSTNNPKTA
jgi:hypothetical protein